LFPFPDIELKEILAKFPNAKDIIWCQEEPKNQGAWYPSAHNIIACLEHGQSLRYVGRPASASPAVGNLAIHIQQQKDFIFEALK